MYDYHEAFMKGLNEVIYSDYPEQLSEPEVDYKDLASIGYYDGFSYGIYCEQTGQLNAIKQEHLVAVIDKAFARAYDKHKEALEQHTR